MKKTFEQTEFVTYRWKYLGQDEFLQARGLLDEETLDNYCLKHNIKPQREIKDKREMIYGDYYNTPGRDELLALAKSGCDKTLLINHFGVLANSQKDIYQIVKLLHDGGMSIICVDEEIEVTLLPNGYGIVFQQSEKVNCPNQ